ncbi:MAG: Uma2 family endonuclease [Anaerolineae bacterium]|nr:Uma2 family endonuclease [Phycisphaerae bacterium]
MQATKTKSITADELLAMGDIGRCELIYGELVMMSPAGVPHGIVAMRFGRFLSEFVDQHDLGIVLAAETGFKIESNPDLVRAPDASFVRKDRLIVPLPKGFFEGVPDLAVEVASPDDSRREVSEKVNMWLAHGTQTVWVADPQTMTVVVHRVGQPPRMLRTTDEIAKETLLPGFVLPLAKVFKLP